MRIKRFFFPHWLLLGIIFIFLFKGQTIIQALYLNGGHSLGNLAIGNPWLDTEMRQTFYQTSSFWLQTDDASNPLRVTIDNEKTAYNQTYKYMLTTDMGKVPSRQLLSNSDFTFGLIGWGQYNSSWSIESDDATSSQVATYINRKNMQSSLYQTLYLPSGKCFVFSIFGEVEREDNTPTFWGYWETYDTQSNPIGNSILSAKGDQSRQDRYGSFCLPPEKNNSLIKVIVAPVNLYGKATAYLRNVRLYELQDNNLE